MSSFYDLPSSLSLQLLPAGKTGAELLFALSLAAAAGAIGAVDARSRREERADGELDLMSRIPRWGNAIAYGAIFYLITVCGLSANGFLYEQF